MSVDFLCAALFVLPSIPSFIHLSVSSSPLSSPLYGRLSCPANAAFRTFSFLAWLACSLVIILQCRLFYPGATARVADYGEWML